MFHGTLLLGKERFTPDALASHPTARGSSRTWADFRSVDLVFAVLSLQHVTGEGIGEVMGFEPFEFAIVETITWLAENPWGVTGAPLNSPDTSFSRLLTGVAGAGLSSGTSLPELGVAVLASCIAEFLRPLAHRLPELIQLLLAELA